MPKWEYVFAKTLWSTGASFVFYFLSYFTSSITFYLVTRRTSYSGQVRDDESKRIEADTVLAYFEILSLHERTVT